MNPTLSTLIAAAVPTLAVILAVVRNEFAVGTLSIRITSLENRLDARMETLDRDLRDWAKITMQHNTEMARLKDKTGIE